MLTQEHDARDLKWREHSFLNEKGALTSADSYPVVCGSEVNALRVGLLLS